MDQPTETKDSRSHDCSCGMGGCHGHWGRFSLLRILLALIVAVLLFVFGFALGRVSGGRFRAGNMMYYRGGAPLMRYYQGYAPGTMVPYGNWPTATSTPAK